MIKSITVTNFVGESLEILLREPEKSGFLIKDITGLGPPKANINYTELASFDGGLYNSARANTRNIVFTFKLLGKPTIEATRRLSYKFFPIKQKVTIKIVTEGSDKVLNKTFVTEGYVEKNEPTIFSNSETIQVSLICPDSYFSADVGTTHIFSDADPTFEFDFSDEIGKEGYEPTLEFTSFQPRNNGIIYYEGDNKTGFYIRILTKGRLTNPTIVNDETEEFFRINTSMVDKVMGTDNVGIKAGDEITICTIKGKKGIVLLRSGKYYNLLNCIDRDSTWLELSEGFNKFYYVTDDETYKEALNVTVYFSYKKLYEGV